MESKNKSTFDGRMRRSGKGDRTFEVSAFRVIKQEKGIILCKYEEGNDEPRLVETSPLDFVEALEWVKDVGWLVEEESDREFYCVAP